MTNSVIIKGLRIFAHHGVLPQERKVGAYFILDISIQTDFSQAMLSDDLEGTISYADVCDIIHREMSTPSKLIEHVAQRIVNAIFKAFTKAESIRLSIIKENPHMGADCVGSGVEVFVDKNHDWH